MYTHDDKHQKDTILGTSEKKLANKILGRKEGELFNSETMLAARDLLVTSMTKLDELAKVAVVLSTEGVCLTETVPPCNTSTEVEGLKRNRTN